MKWTSPAKWMTLALALVCLSSVGLCVKENALGQWEEARREGRWAGNGDFVIADFDGDQKPDMATVQQERSESQSTNYSIHFELSQGWQPAIDITARAGGLKLFWRDVNGDDALDLVVRTSLDSKLVAVLLNDGHGKFTEAPAKQFEGLRKEPDFHLGVERRSFTDEFSMLPLRTIFCARGEQAYGFRPQRNSEVVYSQKSWLFSSLLRQTVAGRAPPAFQ